jgi:hypothetical protein
MKVHTIHGVVTNYKKGAQVHRNYVGESSFISYLEQCGHYTQWSGGDGTVLTVDDSTEAGVYACRIARSLAHEVVFFINPWQIESGECYFFSHLDTILDSRGVQKVTYNGSIYSLAESSGVKAFRLAVREHVMGLEPSSAVAAVKALADLCHARTISPPDFAFPPSLDKIRLLRDIGVRVESHGWSHVDVRAMDNAAFLSDIIATADWFEDNLSVSSTLYAVPFGVPDLREAFRAEIRGEYCIVDRQRDIGRIGRNCVNRLDITGLINEY